MSVTDITLAVMSVTDVGNRYLLHTSSIDAWDDGSRTVGAGLRRQR